MIVIPGERSETRDPLCKRDSVGMVPGSALRYGRDDNAERHRSGRSRSNNPWYREEHPGKYTRAEMSAIWKKFQEKKKNQAKVDEFKAEYEADKARFEKAKKKWIKKNPDHPLSQPKSKGASKGKKAKKDADEEESQEEETSSKKTSSKKTKVSTTVKATRSAGKKGKKVVEEEEEQSEEEIGRASCRERVSSPV